jgi:phosphotransferase system HPr (HPr) family protein
MITPARATIEKELTILNKLGLHARPASEFVRCANKFKSNITIRKDGQDYSAASILDVLSANLDCGSHMVLAADGPDAAEALDQLAALLVEFEKQERDA